MVNKNKLHLHQRHNFYKILIYTSNNQYTLNTKIQTIGVQVTVPGLPAPNRNSKSVGRLFEHLNWNYSAYSDVVEMLLASQQVKVGLRKGNAGKVLTYTFLR